MGYDYDRLYGQTRDALGAPSACFVNFFNGLPKSGLRVLDVGCGQGRDALPIARRGHSVTGVDLSPNGIRDLRDAARAEALSVRAVVADVVDYEPEGRFDVVLIDRTLHLLGRDDRLAVLARLLDHVAEEGWLLIADEPSNVGDFEAVIAAHDARWDTVRNDRGTLFVRRL